MPGSVAGPAPASVARRKQESLMFSRGAHQPARCRLHGVARPVARCKGPLRRLRRPCAVRRGRAVLVAVGVAGGFWLPAASAPVSGLSVLAFLGVSRVSFSRCGSARFAGSPRRALVALAGRVGAVVWRSALAQRVTGRSAAKSMGPTERRERGAGAQ